MAIFRSEGSNNWRMVSYSVAAKLPTAVVSIVASSLGEDGYITYSNGYIEQWGKEARTGNITTVTYPIAFPTGVYNVQATGAANSASGGFSNAVAIDDDSITTTVFDFGSGAGYDFVYWRATGH